MPLAPPNTCGSCTKASAPLRDVLLLGELLLGELDTRDLPKQAVDLGAFVAELSPVHRLAAEQCGIALAFTPPAQHLQTRVHVGQFSRVLDNLLTNALAFTPRGGRIAVALRQKAGRPLLTVQDTDQGIPADLQAHLFGKFSPAARPGLRQEAPTGLGLFITRQIVQRHGGRVWVESTEGQGTTFFVELP